jgi:predicted SnoaL-like aldol condensation-catalyzing enzyme
MEDSKSNKHLPRLFEQGLNDKRVELFDELIHPEYNSHNAYVEPGRRALSILSAPPRTKIHTEGGDNANL